MRTLLFGIFLAIVGAAVYLTISLGAFKSVEITESSYPELKLIYRDHIGPYHKIGDVIKSLEEWAHTNNVECKITFGQFMDDPRIVEHERLRSRGGCVVKNFPPQLPPETKMMTVPERSYLIAKFEGSPWLGPYKVYNQVAEMAQEKKIEIKEPVIEIYELFSSDKMRTTYLFPIN